MQSLAGNEGSVAMLTNSTGQYFSNSGSHALPALLASILQGSSFQVLIPRS